MNYKNGYKVVYEVAANGERTFYASKSDIYPKTDDVKLASFKDAEYAGKTIYEHAGEFYVADTTAAKFDEEGNPTGTKLVGMEDTNFDEILVEKAASYGRRAPEDVVEDPEDDEEDLDPEEDELEEDETETEE